MTNTEKLFEQLKQQALDYQSQYPLECKDSDIVVSYKLTTVVDYEMIDIEIASIWLVSVRYDRLLDQLYMIFSKNQTCLKEYHFIHPRLFANHDSFDDQKLVFGWMHSKNPIYENSKFYNLLEPLKNILKMTYLQKTDCFELKNPLRKDF